MTNQDLGYVKSILAKKLIESPVLELGSGYGGDTCRDVLVASGLAYCGTDMAAGPGVDVPANFENDDCVELFGGKAPFASALVLNVLEHTFNPIAVLDNTFKLVKPGGTVVALTPAVWPLHSYPFDAYRILPNFYEIYAKRRGVEIIQDTFEYVGYGNVNNYRNANQEYRFPEAYRSKGNHTISQIVHRIFNTSGRGIMFKNHIAIACVYRKPL